MLIENPKLIDSCEIHAKLSARTTPVLVVEGTSSELAHEKFGGSVEIALPAMPAQIVEAVDRARGVRSAA